MSERGTTIMMMRRERGWDQAELADRSGVSISTISRIETGKKDPSLEQLVAFSKALGVSITTIDPTAPALETDGDRHSSPSAQNVLSRTMPQGRIPLLVENEAGAMGEFIKEDALQSDTECPPALAAVPGAFAVQIPDMKMFPRFRPGEILYIHPKTPIRIGDDVLLQWAKPGTRGTQILLGVYASIKRADDGNNFCLKQIETNEPMLIPTHEARIMKVVGVLFL